MGRAVYVWLGSFTPNDDVLQRSHLYSLGMSSASYEYVGMARV